MKIVSVQMRAKAMKDKLVFSEAVLRRFLAAIEAQTHKDPQQLMAILMQIAAETKTTRQQLLTGRCS
jgi:hypothetical protein